MGLRERPGNEFYCVIVNIAPGISADQENLFVVVSCFNPQVFLLDRESKMLLQFSCGCIRVWRCFDGISHSTRPLATVIPRRTRRVAASTTDQLFQREMTRKMCRRDEGRSDAVFGLDPHVSCSKSE
jgi:hypothetical protein